MAVLLVALAAELTRAGEPLLAPQYSLLFYAAVLGSAWYGGLGPGLLATALAATALDFLFVPPRYSFGQFSVRDAVGLAVFAAVAVVTSSLSARLRAQRERAEEHAREVERLAAELEARSALRLEEKVREAEALAAELALANRALARKSEEAEAATRAKSAFLAAVSHELRTPLNAIAGYAELIADGVRGPVTPEQRHDLARIQFGQQHLLALINDLLDAAKIEAGQLSLEIAEVAPAEVVARAAALAEPVIAAKGLRLERTPMDDVPLVRADPDRLLQVLVNLLSNAAKFTQRGTVGVAARVAGSRVAISVSDTGRGIPTADLERIFEPFAQVQRADGEEQHGTGLGLAISRDLARAMGGDLTVESTPGVGSTFTVWLARAGVAAPAAAAGVLAAGVLTLWPPVEFLPLG
ncbi:MAG: ATP-binding protein [Gemmatimonadaceae bacterium]